MILPAGAGLSKSQLTVSAVYRQSLTAMEDISARERVLRVSPTQHARNMYIAPAGPPLGNDQMTVMSAYSQAHPKIEANPKIAHGPKYRYKRAVSNLKCTTWQHRIL